MIYKSCYVIFSFNTLISENVKKDVKKFENEFGFLTFQEDYYSSININHIHIKKLISISIV